MYGCTDVLVFNNYLYNEIEMYSRQHIENVLKLLTLPLNFVNSNFRRGRRGGGGTMKVPLILDQAANRQTEQNIMLSSSNFESVC